MLASSILFAATPAVALDPAKAITQYVHDKWQVEDGLPDNRLWSMAEARDGYLWLGTGTSLVRFDGVQFTVFDGPGTEAIRNREIRALVEGRDGSLWIGTYGGGLSRLRDGRITTYTVKEGLAGDIVYDLHEDRDGTLWIATAGGLSRFRNGRFKTYTTADGLGANRVYTIAEGREGDLWFGTFGGGLSHFRKGSFTNYTTEDGLGANMVLGLAQTRDGSLWIATYGGGLSRLENGTFTTFTTRDGLTDNRLTDLLEDRDGNLWIAAYDGGLNRFRNGEFTSFGEAQGLSDNALMRLYETRDGSVWTGTEKGGLNRLKDAKFTPYTTREGLSNDRTYAIYPDPTGTLWIGTEGGGLNRFVDGTFTSYTTGDGLASDNVVSIFRDSRGDLWIGTFGGGVSRLRDGRFTTFTTADGLSDNIVYAIHEDRSGALWFGTQEVGLTRFADGKFTVYGSQEGLGAGGVRTILEDRRGTLWFGTNAGGLSRFENGRFTTYTTADGLAGDIVYALREDREGNLWIGTKGGGLSRLRDGRFATIDAAAGLRDNTVFQILEDGNDHLWLCGPKGVSRVRTKALLDVADGRARRVHPDVYGRSDGIRSGQCNGGSQPAGWRTPDGRVWFPTSRGIVVANADHFEIDRRAPRIHLEQFIADARSMPLGGEVKLRPGSRKLEFHFTGISLPDPEHVTFRYRLEGFDPEWVEAGTRRVAYYTNLPPGSYRFQVMAGNSDGIWSEAGGALAFELQPFFYQTRWFVSLVALALLLAALGGHRLRVRALTHRQRDLSRLVTERTRELEDATQELERLSRSDGLTGVANRRHFDDILDREWRRAFRAKSTVSLILVDVDCFKSYNDTYGHLRGDECLKQVGLTLQASATRAGDLAARYGGEEFVILAPDIDIEGALVIAERARAAVELLNLPHERSAAAPVVTISVGVACFTVADGESPDGLIEAADEALYRAKSEGRNRVVASSTLPCGIAPLV